MDKKNLNILIVDYHPFVVDLYTNIINSNNGGKYIFNFFTANNAIEASEKINKCCSENKKINVAFLDINLPPFENLDSGIELIISLKKTFPNCKIIVVTNEAETLKIYNLIQKVNIEMILFKSDINFDDLSKLCITVNYEEQYMSKTVKKEIALLTKKKMNLDNLDLEIIEKLSQGVKTKDLPNFISLGLSAIEKRKARLKSEFLYYNGTDNELLYKIKIMGLL